MLILISIGLYMLTLLTLFCVYIKIGSDTLCYVILIMIAGPIILLFISPVILIIASCIKFLFYV